MFYNAHNRGYQIIGVYHVEREPNYITHVPARAFAAIAYRKKGDAEFVFNDQSIYAGSGTVIYIPSGVDYSIIHGNEELVVIRLGCFGVDGENIEIENVDDELGRFFDDICQVWESRNAASYQSCMVLLYKIFEGLELSKRNKADDVPKVISDGVFYLHQSFRNPSLSIADAASRCHVSEVYFRRVYKEHFGCSPLQTIIDMRFEHACNLLKSGYYRIKEVAALSGFSDTKYFRTAFGKRYGMTPSQFALHDNHKI